MSLLDWLLNPSGLTAHGFCLNWAPGLVALHAGSDAVIGLAYLSIPVALVTFLNNRRDLHYSWMIYLFGGFILACGMTHLFSILTLWEPAYGIEGVLKLITALLSIATAVMLWPLIPKLVALPSPSQLEDVNTKLSATIVKQQQMAALLRSEEARVHNINEELERRVLEQTRELNTSNSRLTEALAARGVALINLARSEETFRASFEAAVVGKVQVEPESACILRVNPAFARMFGYGPEELVGRHAWDFTWPDDRAEGQTEYARLLAGEISTYVREKRYLRRDGSPFWGRVSGTMVRSPETGQPMLLVAVVEDIDESYKARASLEIAKHELEEVIAQRTLALEQRDLLLREVYHRVKNNLQIIDSLLVIQARQVADPQAKSALLNLRGRVQALGLVHNQLMGSDNLKTFNIAPFLQELADNILEGGAATGINLSVRAVPLDVGLDFAIPLGLLVTELVTNSIKHAFPLKAGNIVVTLEQHDDNEVVLVVADDGRGRPDDKLTRLGLGTSIINGLVGQLAGKMTMKNCPGSRTEVRIPEPVLS